VCAIIPSLLKKEIKIMVEEGNNKKEKEQD
jgi:hypothetical protein